MTARKTTAVFIRVEKFTPGSAWRCIFGRQTLGPAMTAQKRSSSRNYIDLVENERDRPAVELPPASARPIRDYLLGLVAAMRPARNEGR
jgi:hypothetical protein